MSFRINPAVQQLFGSETRAKVLGILADSPEPKTGYELSKVLEISPPKVYNVLKTLERAGFLGVVVSGSGFKRYFLADDDLKQFLLKKVRIVLQEEWFSPERVRDRERVLGLAKRLTVNLPKSKGIPKSIPNPQEFVRPPEKDRALARVARK